jgi:hypothetical protein
MHKKEARKSGSHVDDGIAEGKPTVVICDPWNPPYPMYHGSPTRKSYAEWCSKRRDFLKTSRATSVITPDRTPPTVHYMFYQVLYPRLLPILEKDSVARFLRLYAAECGKWMTSGSIITPEAFNHMIAEDALRIAKVVLEVKAPELEGCRTNPNYMNQYGYFPLHEAAERFSLEMIKLLLRHGASANLRTDGAEDLLPLHVAVEGTCLHKYLEDSLLPKQEHHNCPTVKDANYIYKIIHLLCLPEMKMFLDTTRLLAEYTNNLVDEILNYMKDGKLVQTAVLLLAAQAQIRVGSRCGRNGNSTLDGFSIITAGIGQHMISVKLEMCRSKKEMAPDLEAKCEHLSSALLLVKIISQAGNALDSYIGTHQKVPHTKVLERVSQILNDHGFFPSGEGLGIGNLFPYRWCTMPNGEAPEKHGNVVATEAAAKTPNLYPAGKKAARSKLRGRWERECTWNSFFPYWRSVLSQRYPKKAAPAYAQGDALCLPNSDHVHNSGSKSSLGELSMPATNDTARSLARRILQGTRMNQSSRLFGTVALKILKVLKNT